MSASTNPQLITCGDVLSDTQRMEATKSSVSCAHRVSYVCTMLGWHLQGVTMVSKIGRATGGLYVRVDRADVEPWHHVSGPCENTQRSAP